MYIIKIYLLKNLMIIFNLLNVAPSIPNYKAFQENLGESKHIKFDQNLHDSIITFNISIKYD
jgi:hypothetical protein